MGLAGHSGAALCRIPAILSRSARMDRSPSHGRSSATGFLFGPLCPNQQSGLVEFFGKTDPFFWWKYPPFSVGFEGKSTNRASVPGHQCRTRNSDFIGRKSDSHHGRRESRGGGHFHPDHVDYPGADPSCSHPNRSITHQLRANRQPGGQPGSVGGRESDRLDSQRDAPAGSPDNQSTGDPLHSSTGSHGEFGSIGSPGSTHSQSGSRKIVSRLAINRAEPRRARDMGRQRRCGIGGPGGRADLGRI